MTTPEEINRLCHGLRRLLPGPWEAFRDAPPEADRDGGLVAAYHRLLNSPGRGVRLAAARAWCAGEDAVVTHEVPGRPGHCSDRDEASLLAFARIRAHSFTHRVWLTDGQLLRTAGDLARAWPGAQLRVVDGSGPTGSPALRDAVMAAIACPGRGPR